MYLLFSNCIPIKGKKFCIICDLQRNSFEIIPDTLYEILISDFPSTPEILYDKYGESNKSVLNKYFDFLFKNNFIFFSDDIVSFPALSTDFFMPHVITNAIIDIKKASDFNYLKIIDQLNFFNCISLEFRFFDIVEVHSYPSEQIHVKNYWVRVSQDY